MSCPCHVHSACPRRVVHLYTYVRRSISFLFQKHLIRQLEPPPASILAHSTRPSNPISNSGLHLLSAHSQQGHLCTKYNTAHRPAGVPVWWKTTSVERPVFKPDTRPFFQSLATTARGLPITFHVTIITHDLAGGPQQTHGCNDVSSDGPEDDQSCRSSQNPSSQATQALDQKALSAQLQDELHAAARSGHTTPPTGPHADSSGADGMVRRRHATGLPVSGFAVQLFGCRACPAKAGCTRERVSVPHEQRLIDRHLRDGRSVWAAGNPGAESVMLHAAAD